LLQHVSLFGLSCARFCGETALNPISVEDEVAPRPAQGSPVRSSRPGPPPAGRPPMQLKGGASSSKGAARKLHTGTLACVASEADAKLATPGTVSRVWLCAAVRGCVAGSNRRLLEQRQRESRSAIRFLFIYYTTKRVASGILWLYGANQSTVYRVVSAYQRGRAVLPIQL
jgi:hypothetical protein